MAKKKNIQLGIDLQIQNYDNSIQELEKLEKVGGAVGKAAAKLKKEVIEAKNSLVSLGSTATPQELKKLIRVNADLATQMGEIAHEADRVNSQLKATTKNYREAEQAAKGYKKTLAELKAKQEETEKAAKTTKGSRATAKLNASDNSDYKASLDKRGVGKDAKDKNQAY
jgi:chromosome segregation ATPase